MNCCRNGPANSTKLYLSHFSLLYTSEYLYAFKIQRKPEWHNIAVDNMWLNKVQKWGGRVLPSE